MAATTRYTAALLSALSAVSVASTIPPLSYSSCVIRTVYTTVTVGAGWSATTSKSAVATTTVDDVDPAYTTVTVTQQYSIASSWSYPGVVFPTFSPDNLNPNGPFYNPNDFIPYYADWPGKPTKGQVEPPPLPTKASKPYGGASADQFKAPAWQEKGKDLTPELSQDETNGDSKWGLIDCPRLSPYAGLSGASVSASVTASHGPHYSSAPHSEYSYSYEGSSSSYGGAYGSASKSGGHYSGSSGAYHSDSSAFPSFTSRGNYSVSSGAFSKPTSSFSASSFSPSSFSHSSLTSSAINHTSFSSFSSASRSSFSSNHSIASNSSTSKCSAVDDTTELCGAMPDTGVTRRYDFNVGYATIAPDGVQKNGLVVNGQFPGPLIEANWGDFIEITVTNDLPVSSQSQGEGTSLHWHGFLQADTPYYDGVPSVQQCPITPGSSLTYKFRADHVGTSWYHSHYSAQYAGGALGPIVIHGPAHPQACYDEDLGPVMIGDWYHADYFSLVETTMSGGLPFSDNILINGKMNYPCENTTAVCTPNAGISKFAFTPGKKYRLRLINPSAEAIIKFHIDGHNLSVIANDFVPIIPYTTNVVTLGVGQRSDIIVEATGNAGDAFWMRATAGDALLGAGCSITSGVVTEGVAAVYYDDADTNSEPASTSDMTTAQLKTCQNDDLSLTQSICPFPLGDSFEEEDLLIELKSNGTDNVWYFGNSSFRADYNTNLLDQVSGGNLTFAPEWNVHPYDDSSKDSVRIIVENSFFLPHPMHLHGHDFNILAVGTGAWDGTIVNPSNTQVRDVQLVPGAGAAGNGFLVIQFPKNNPGIWPFHCHIAWHVSAGLYVNVLEAPSRIDVTVPQSVKDTCLDWAAWEAAGNIPPQIDSGL